MPKEILLVIDPQEDFCEKANGIGGALAVQGGRAALKRVATFIRRYGSKFDDIIVTLDCHNPLHIAHPIWTLDEHDRALAPFTALKEDRGEIVYGGLDASGFHAKGKGHCQRPGFTKWTLHYLRELEAGKRYPHMIWPPHCLIGTPGGCMIPEIAAATREWEERDFGVASKVSKGSNIKTEHFGALRAEVVDPDDPSTQVNSYFLSLLSDPETIIYGCGLALGHCLANTCMDVANEFDADTFCKRFVLLRDGTEHVAGLEFLGDKFVKDFEARGMRVCNTTDL